MALDLFARLAAGTLLFAVVALVITRPRGLSVAWPAGIGALVAVALRLISFNTLHVIFGDVWNAAATLIALFVLSEALDSNGFFTWAALHLARLARGSGPRLYLMVLLLTTAVTALLANDGAVLMLTPIYATLLTKIYGASRLRLPYLLAAGFFADAMSGLFIPSNLTNIIIADANRLNFARSAMWMVLPTLAAFVTAGAAFALRFRTSLRTPYALEAIGVPAEAIHDRVVFWAGWAALGALILGYVISSAGQLPISVVAGLVALAMLGLTSARRLRPVAEQVRAAPWGILIYALGMFVVMTAAYRRHVLDVITDPLRAHVLPSDGPLGTLFAGGLLGLLSAAANNLPATLVGVLALRSAPHILPLATYAIMLGVDIGPKLTPYGSLATLLWLGILERHGIHISWGRYLRELVGGCARARRGIWGIAALKCALWLRHAGFSVAVLRGGAYSGTLSSGGACIMMRLGVTRVEGIEHGPRVRNSGRGGARANRRATAAAAWAVSDALRA
ncbi:MAG: arsenical efflux pump membrane protein ArsB [Ktedonobacterales bacterium]|nr:arsenical efflux pump membrane protein ArsB [Ktedonobacterales bacterium]